MSKRPSGVLASLVSDQNKSARLDERSQRSQRHLSNNPFLSRPVNPEDALKIFLWTARSKARENVPKEVEYPIAKPFCEIEARLGVLSKKSSFGLEADMRVLSSGPKKVPFRGKETWMSSFDCTSVNENNRICNFEGGISKTNFIVWTSAGLSEPSPISSAFGLGHSLSSSDLKRELSEKDQVETVYSGYSNSNRARFDGIHHEKQPGRGQFENKAKLVTMDLALPASSYDLRLGLATERVLDAHLKDVPSGWTAKRLKRRKSYARRDNKFAWQLDVTEVTTTNSGGDSHIEYEIEMELNEITTLLLINETEESKVKELCTSLAQQLWWMIRQINPVSDVLNVEDFLMDHPDSDAVTVALAQCAALKSFMDSRKRGDAYDWRSPISNGIDNVLFASLSNVRFPGSMPVNFSRHDIEKIQRSDESGGYFLSEKTDGVRYFMVFTGSTVVLVDRSMRGKQPIPKDESSGEPMSRIIPLIKPGTVFDGEVVMHRKLRRPIFIVFDVLSISTTELILHLPFQERLNHLKSASFRTPGCNQDMFSDAALMDTTIALPLVRKKFVRRMELDELFSHVTEESGHRTYKNGDTHNHLTDGIIFQPNLPYVCGTDMNLLKWKYLDTVTIDVQIIPPGYSDTRNTDDKLNFFVTDDQGSFVNMTRFIHLPKSELRRLEADKAESGATIAEVGLEPSTGEWYYLTMRPDKNTPNHISTVLGTLLELAESLGTEELRYRMSVPPNVRDSFRKDIRRMQNQLLEFQRKSNKEAFSRLK